MKNVSLLMIVASLAMSMNAAADQCTKDFPAHLVTPEGRLAFWHGVGAGWWYVCNISTAENGIAPESCKAALTTYLSAKAQGKPITVSYAGTCAQLDSGVAHSDGFSWFGVVW